MNTCTTCYHKNACKSFDVVKEETATACEHHLDENLVVILPCPINTTVYEFTKDCEHCPNYHEVAYSDYVSCEEDNNLYSYNANEEFHDDEKECLKHIRIRPVHFNLNMINRYGRDVFLTQRVAFLHFAQEIYILAGYRYGKATYLDCVKNTIEWDKPVTIVFPEKITKVNDGFVQGFFEEIREHWTIADIMEKLNVISSIPNLKDIMIQSLL